MPQDLTIDSRLMMCVHFFQIKHSLLNDELGRAIMRTSIESLLGDRTVLLISLALLSLGLPLGIFATKMFLKDSRAIIAKCLSYEFLRSQRRIHFYLL